MIFRWTVDTGSQRFFYEEIFKEIQAFDGITVCRLFGRGDDDDFS